MSNTFFNKRNVFKALWAVIIFVAGLLIASIFKIFSGPDKVIFEPSDSFKSIDSTVNIIKIEGDPITLEEIRKFNPYLSIQSNQESITRNTATISRPKFNLPNIVKGYNQKTLNSFAIIDLPSQTYTQHEIIEFNLKFFDESMLLKISPVIVTITKEISSLKSDIVWEEQFKILHLNNTIRFASDFSKGLINLHLVFILYLN